MKKALLLCYIAALCASCGKSDKPTPAVVCDVEKARADNASKVTITNGIWGTLSLLTGDCMPLRSPNKTSCSNCPVKRTMRIYERTTTAQATPANEKGWYDSFSTRLLKEFSSDDNGFFQVEIDPGAYTLVVMDSGKIYAFGGADGQGDICLINITGGKQQADRTMVVNAVF
ncbi:hypothetical protein Q4E93_19560 [Flavitalea sp. BT771]|uniref:hypothetical protein n=1 Tax=Flavitalea sp. BT771 TaxID=3063329 RepID=UPI0026E2DFEB|nr:hypothetical protein [Flavitalea sp. BT771]MDO6432814.1 hypothetical protein [Flavitalea sp. BT771]MDV6221910.1 hypothetical protein [Flavitalea sp. BT771]